MILKKVFVVEFYIFFVIAVLFISGVEGFVKTAMTIFAYFWIFYLISFIYKKIRDRLIPSMYEFSMHFFYRLALFMFSVIVIIGTFAYYNNEIRPAPMTTYKISNGEKTIIFQSMSHIGTRDFYDRVIENIREAKKLGYVLYFEGVKSGTSENNDKFDRAMGIKFDEELYSNFSKLYGVTNQNNWEFLGIENNLDYNVDLDINQIIEEYEKKLDENHFYVSQDESVIPIDISKEVTSSLTELNDKELAILVYVNKSILNFMIRSEGLRDYITESVGNKELFEVILDNRNKLIAERFINSNHNNIIATYGLMHFRGVMQILEADDSKWQIIDEEVLYPIK